jgi:hypothetical protein
MEPSPATQAVYLSLLRATSAPPTDDVGILVRP